MSEIREGLKYSTSHTWARIEPDGTVTVGLTDHAQDAIGRILRVTLPAVGARVTRGDPAGAVASALMTSDLYSPIAGEVVAIHEAPAVVNDDPYGEGWIFLVRPDDLGDLDEALEAEDYRELLTVEEE